MSIVDYVGTSVIGEDGVPTTRRHLHRLATVRRLQQISRRAVARRLNVDLAEICRQEDETSDLPLSVLFEWHKALDVPIVELLVEPEDSLSRPFMQRAQLVRLMKTALTILEQVNEESERLLAETLVDQLIKVMPELQGINAWHTVGQRRTLGELGIAALRRLSEEVFFKYLD